MPASRHAPAATRIFTGCAGWSLPRPLWSEFAATGSHLERYASGLDAAEINSSFYRPHQRTTYERWAASVPPRFRFSVKLPKAITHEARLVSAAPLLEAFLDQATALGERLGCLLVQLPPSLSFDERAVSGFLRNLRQRHEGPVALEPRHASWFEAPAAALLHSFQIARVLADPVLHEAGRWPGGWPGLVYLRLHGSPRPYYSSYEAATLDLLAARLALAAASASQVWCIFDNTASAAAAENALYVSRALRDLSA